MLKIADLIAMTGIGELFQGKAGENTVGKHKSHSLYTRRKQFWHYRCGILTVLGTNRSLIAGIGDDVGYRPRINIINSLVDTLPKLRGGGIALPVLCQDFLNGIKIKRKHWG